MVVDTVSDLVDCDFGDGKIHGNRLLEVEALELAEMHGNFGHKFVAVSKIDNFHVIDVGKRASLHCKNQFDWPIRRTPLSFWSMRWYLLFIKTFCYQPGCLSRAGCSICSPWNWMML